MLIIYNIIFGFIAGYILFKYCNPSIKYHGPNSNIVKRQIYKSLSDGKCYVFKPQAYICPLRLNIK